MGFRFKKSINAGPLRINLSKSGIGYSFGVKGARITKPSKGKAKATIGIPGTGISYSKSIGEKKKHTAKDSTVQKNNQNKQTNQINEPSGLTAAEYNVMGTRIRWLLVIILLMSTLFSWFSLRSALLLLGTAAVLPVAAWQNFLTVRLRMPLPSKAAAATAFILGAMFANNKGMLALSGLLLILSALLTILNTRKEKQSVEPNSLTGPDETATPATSIINDIRNAPTDYIFPFVIIAVGLCIFLLGLSGKTKEPPTPPTEPAVIATAETETEAAVTEVTTEEATVPTEAPTTEATTIPTEAPTTEPETTSPTVAETTEEPTTTATTESTEPEEEMVWIPTNGGTKYHSRPSCSGMDSPQSVSISRAIAKGFKPCKRCH